MNRKSIGSVLSSLRGQEVIVELKNDRTVRGILDDGDWGMNLVMRNVSIENADDNKSTIMEQLMVSGRSIRYIHLPPSLDWRVTISQYLDATTKTLKRNKPPKLR